MSDLKTFVETWLAAVERGDVDALVGMCAPGVELSSPQGELHGRDQVRAMFNAWVNGFSERRHPISNTVEANDVIVVEFPLIGKHTGAMTTSGGVIPPTGKLVCLQTITIYEIQDGKLTRSRAQYDMLSFLGQLGLLPAPVHS